MCVDSARGVSVTVEQAIWVVHWGLPVKDSGSQRTLQILRHFATIGTATLIDVAPEPAEPSPDDTWEYRHDGARVPSISDCWRRTLPDVWSKRAESIADSYVQEAAKAGVDILMFSVWPLVPSRASRMVEGRPAVIWDGDSFSCYHGSRAVARSVPRIQRAHSAWLAGRYRRFERRFSRGVDHITLCGPLDVAAVKRQVQMPASWVPNPVSQVRRSAGQEIYNFGFLGSAWAPNRDGLQWLLREVWPAVVRARPRATLAIAGTVPFEDQTGVIRLGRVPDKNVFYSQVGAAVIPIDYGSGTQFKLIETADLGIPVYTTVYGSQSTTLPHLTVLDGRAAWIRRLIAHLDGDLPRAVAGSPPDARAAMNRVLGELR